MINLCVHTDSLFNKEYKNKNQQYIYINEKARREDVIFILGEHRKKNPSLFAPEGKLLIRFIEAQNRCSLLKELEPLTTSIWYELPHRKY